MINTRKNTYARIEVGNKTWPLPNTWDMLALVLVIALIFTLGTTARALFSQYHLGQMLPISLSPWHLPYYAARTVLRMFIALFFSLLSTFIFGTWAAKSAYAERIIIPMIDVLQSVPVLGFLSITVVGFITLFHGSMLGPECAAIFAIFVAQVWNMTLSLYQSLRTVPQDLIEAANVFQLSPWQRYWRVEVPFAMPGLIWNTMMSMSGSWVFLVASEAISTATQKITLPGVGSYIAKAISHADKPAIAYVILTMIIVIGLYDQLLFRPLVAWAEKFKAEETANEVYPESWLLALFQRTTLFIKIGDFIQRAGDLIVNCTLFKRAPTKPIKRKISKWHRIAGHAWNILLALIVLAITIGLIHFILKTVSLHEINHVIFLGFITGLRVTLLIALSSLVWVPISVWIGFRPRLSQAIQPVVQFFAAFPANLLFPVVVMIIVRYQLNVNIWTSPLMILGTQWYIVFNVIAGTIAIPKNLQQAVSTLNVKGWLKWRRFILPAIFPYYITGVITAAGGAWNMSIIAEVVSWGKVNLHATGLGAYIDQVYSANDFPRLALGITVMSLYVLLINRLLWRPLYNLAEKRYVIK